jgi:hypothetical protein
VNVIVNQLDKDIAESMYRNSMTLPVTHRLAVLASLLKSMRLNKLKKGAEAVSCHSLVSSGKLLDAVGKRVGQSMWGSFVNMMSVGDKESANDMALDAKVRTIGKSAEVTDASETVVEFKSYSKFGKIDSCGSYVEIQRCSR